MSSLSLITIIGFLFDAFNIILSIVDAYSDAAVAFEFRDNGRTGFYYACAIIFVLGMISDSFSFALAYSAPRRQTRAEIMSTKQTSPPRFSRAELMTIITIVCTPIAHFLPLVNYYLSLTDETYNPDITMDADWEKAERSAINKFKNSSTSTAAKNLMNKSDTKKGSLTVEVDHAVAKRMRTLIVSNVNTCVQSLPASVVQLLAIGTSSVEPTPIQAFSLSLSLFSIAMKACFAARSFNFNGFASKLSFVIFDLFSLAFMSCSLFLGNVPSETTFSFFFFFNFFEPVPVTYLTYTWLVVRISSIAIVLFLYMSVYLKEVILRQSYPFSDKVKDTGLFLFIMILAAIPLTILMDGIKLTSVFLFNLQFEADAMYFSHVNLLHSFIWGGSGKKNRVETTDWYQTLEKVRSDIMAVIPKRSSFSGSYHLLPSELEQQMNPAKVLARCRVSKESSSSSSSSQLILETDNFLTRSRSLLAIRCLMRMKNCLSDFYHLDSKYLLGEFEKDTKHFQVIHRRVFQRQQNEAGKEEQNEYSTLVKANTLFHEMWRMWDILNRYPEESNRYYHSTSGGYSAYQKTFLRTVIETSVCTLLPLMFTVSGIFGLVFPFLHFFWYSQYWNIVQTVTFVPTVIAFASSMCLLPSALRYIFTSAVSKLMDIYDRDLIMTIADVYHSLPLDTVRKVAVSDDGTIPRDAFDKHVLCFLNERMVGLHGAGEEEIEKIFDELAQITKKKEE